MQIKRFEAADMTTALQLVKQAFGPDAVILSARSIQRETGLFGWMHRPGVEVTAAIDAHPKTTDPTAQTRQPAPAAAVARPLAVDHPGARPISGQRPTACYSYSRNGLIQARRNPPPTPATAVAELRRILTAHGVHEALIRDLIQRLPVPEATPGKTSGQALSTALATALEAKSIAAAPGPLPRVIALVGPTGVGKTTTAARIAARHCTALEGRIGLISCDDRKIAADTEIQLYANIIGVPLSYAWSPEAMAEAMARMQDRELVIIDTPGVSPCHRNGLAVLKEMLAIAGGQVHLLLSAAAKPDDLEKTLDRFSELDVERLAFTRLDETETQGILLNLPTSRRIPLSWITFGPQIPEALRPASAPALARLLIDPSETMEKWRGRSVWIIAEKSAPPPAAERQPASIPQANNTFTAPYIASRNSDVFHRPECKWVRTIKAANRISFDSRTAAESRHFSACPTCCPQRVDPMIDSPPRPCHQSPATGQAQA